MTAYRVLAVLNICAADEVEAAMKAHSLLHDMTPLSFQVIENGDNEGVYVDLTYEQAEEAIDRRFEEQLLSNAV